MKRVTSDQIEEVVTVLRQGGVIVFPTETSYGIGCDATNVQAVERVFAIKGRQEGKGLPVLLPSADMASQFVVMSERALDLARQHWPGPLNIVAPILPGTAIRPRCTSGGFQSLRVSSHTVASQIARALGGPIVATSANISGTPALYDVSHIDDDFAGRPDKPDLIVDVGALHVTPASTTVRIIGDEVQVVRQGSIVVTGM